MRAAIAVALAVALQAAGLSAPLVHAHPDEHATSHHSGRAVHTHWAGHTQISRSSDAQAVHAPDADRALSLNIFVAVAAASFAPAAVTPDAIDLPVPAVRLAHEPVEVTHGHDPPFYRSLPTRAPPALLS